ncbi:MAG: YafY family transcriptional regulator [Saccharospirillaceae bacterium]|jgi:predicted DNA-binding transcriptional regulator YafY|nr:hypothetical protein A3759_12625 [Thalassolituus sp. HI0120]MCH2040376.1 YafY family transcriptional regulator [Saccharospirillaceae bacterium]
MSNKSERLFQLVTLLRSRRTAITAETLAEFMEVSVRTIYRDIQALVVSGIPVEGEAGIGYRLRPGFQLPPLMFDFDEVQSILLGTHMVAAWTDQELAQAARRAEAKIRAVLPEQQLMRADNSPYCVPPVLKEHPVQTVHLNIRHACERLLKVTMDYEDAQGSKSQRTVWPLGMLFWGQRWTFLAWCESRDAYRSFRLDRVNNIDLLNEHYPRHPQRNLQHYLQQWEEH